MKKLLLFFTVTAIALTTGCDPRGNSWQWWIKNSTDQVLKLKHFSYMPYTPAYGTAIILPGDSIVLDRIGHKPKVSLRFDDYFEKSAGSYGENVYWQLLSEDDVVLRTWSYSNKNLPDQRFFEESAWHFDKISGGDSFVIMQYIWTFHISPEDIQ